MSEQYFFSMSEHFIACTEMVAQMARFMNVLNSASLLPPESRPALDSLALIIAARSQQQLVNLRQMIHLPQEVTMALEGVAKQFTDTISQRCNVREQDLKGLGLSSVAGCDW